MRLADGTICARSLKRTRRTPGAPADEKYSRYLQVAHDGAPVTLRVGAGERLLPTVSVEDWATFHDLHDTAPHPSEGFSLMPRP